MLIQFLKLVLVALIYLPVFDLLVIPRATPAPSAPRQTEKSPSDNEPESASALEKDSATATTEDTNQGTPSEIARQEKLVQADKLYLAGEKTAAVKLYQEAKEIWATEQDETSDQAESAISSWCSPKGYTFGYRSWGKPPTKGLPACARCIAFSDPQQLSPGGKVFWRNYQQGKTQQYETNYHQRASVYSWSSSLCSSTFDL